MEEKAVYIYVWCGRESCGTAIGISVRRSFSLCFFRSSRSSSRPYLERSLGRRKGDEHKPRVLGFIPDPRPYSVSMRRQSSKDDFSPGTISVNNHRGTRMNSQMVEPKIYSQVQIPLGETSHNSQPRLHYITLPSGSGILGFQVGTTRSYQVSGCVLSFGVTLLLTDVVRRMYSA